MPIKLWDEIINPFPNFNGYIIEVWEWINNVISHFKGCNNLSMLGLEMMPFKVSLVVTFRFRNEMIRLDQRR